MKYDKGFVEIEKRSVYSNVGGFLHIDGKYKVEFGWDTIALYYTTADIKFWKELNGCK